LWGKSRGEKRGQGKPWGGVGKKKKKIPIQAEGNQAKNKMDTGESYLIWGAQRGTGKLLERHWGMQGERKKKTEPKKKNTLLKQNELASPKSEKVTGQACKGFKEEQKGAKGGGTSSGKKLEKIRPAVKSRREKEGGGGF